MRIMIARIYSILLIIGLWGCEDFLERKPQGQTSTESFLGNEENSDENFEIMLHAAYASFYVSENSWGSHNHHGEWMTGDWLSDDVQKGGDGYNDFSEVMQWRSWNTMPSTANHENNVWRTGYFGISKANVIIQLLDRYKGYMSLPAYNRIKGEALFIRAYFYFYLARVFGSVPYFDHPILPDEYKNPKKATPAELYAYIESDLKDAIDILPSKNSFPEEVSSNGRATKGSAYALLARVISMEIGFSLNEKKWQEVYDATKAVINSGEYALAPNYAKLFEISEEETPEVKAEMVFEIICADLGGSTAYGAPGGNIENRMVTFRPVSTNPFLAPDGWGFSCPNKSLYDIFEPGDVRRECTIIKNGDRLWEDGDTMTNETINTYITNQCPTGYWTRKFATSVANTPSKNTNGPSNMRKIRYADVLLLCAEAAYHIGNNTDAITYLSMVRNRAIASTPPLGSVLGNSGYPAATGTLAPINTSLTGDALLNAIKHERRVELAVEGHRAWDLIRWGDYEKALKERIIPEDRFLKTLDVNEVVANYKSHMINGVPTLPIPPDDASQYNIEQNPGY